MTKITAHRGFSVKYPENTLLAFEKAVELGAERVELDVHFSKDKKLIVHHDYTLGRSNDGEGLIYEVDSDYIKSLDAGRWFSKTFSGLRIPFLQEVFEQLGNKIVYEIELKGLGQGFIQEVVRVVQEYSVAGNVEFTSPSVPTLQTVKEILPTSKIGLFVPRLRLGMTPTLGQQIAMNDLFLGGFAVAHCNLELLDEAFVEKLKRKDIVIHAADCNNKEDLNKAFALKVHQISTDDVELALDVRMTTTT